METHNRTVLVTGVAGLMGSRFAKHLLSKGNVHIIGIDNLSGGYLDNVPPGVEFHHADAATCDLDAIIADRTIDVVVHYAALAWECLSPFMRKATHMSNLIATTNVINACIKHNVGRLVYASSMSIYGDQIPPFDESMPGKPIDPYALSKYASMLDIQIAGTQHGLDWCILIPRNVYGVGQDLLDPYRNFIGICLYKALHDDPLTIYGDGLQVRSFTYIDDILEPMWQACVSPAASHEVINLGGIVKSTILDAANTVLDVVGQGSVVHLPPRYEVREAFATWQKSVELLGFDHRTSLREGVTEMWAWAQKFKGHPRRIFQSYELDVGLYPQWKPEALVNGYWKT